LRFILFENPLTIYSYLILKMKRILRDLAEYENV